MTRKQKILLFVGLALGATIVGRLFLNSPIAHIQLAAETVGNDIFGRWDLSNSIIAAWIAMGILVVLAFFATRRMGLVPRGLQNFMEAVTEAILSLVENVAGKANGRRFFPLIATIFLFIVVANWISLTPVFGTIGKVDTAEFHLTHKLESVLKDLEKDVPALAHDFRGYLEEVEHNAEEHGRNAAPPPPPATIFGKVALQLQRDAGDDKLAIFDRKKSPFFIEIGFDKVKEIELGEYWDFKNWRARTGEVLSDESTVNLDGKTVGILLPYLRNANTDLMVTLGMTLVAMGFIQYWGIRANGFRGYASRFINFREGLIGLFVGILEGISEFAKLISFSFRLLGNMFAGEILIFSLLFLLPIMAGVFIFPFFLELFVGFIQAVVFAALTLVFAVLAVASHSGHAQGEEAGASDH